MILKNKRLSQRDFYMTKSVPVSMMKKSEYLRTILIPELEKDLSSSEKMNANEKIGKEKLLKSFKKQLKDIETGTAKDGPSVSIK